MTAEQVLNESNSKQLQTEFQQWSKENPNYFTDGSGDLFWIILLMGGVLLAIIAWWLIKKVLNFFFSH